MSVNPSQEGGVMETEELLPENTHKNLIPM